MLVIPPLSSKLLDSALDAASQTARDLVTESQMVAIIIEQERTGLSEDDVRASWPDINPGSEVPGELGLLSKSRAFRLVAWLRKQPTPSVPEPEPEPAERCTCDSISAALEATSSAEAQAMWAPTLEVLSQELPATTFDTWLMYTEGFRCDGNNLVVWVPSMFTIAWLEQRMYQTILRALRGVAGDQWDVRFEASETVVCPVHGTSAPVG